MPPRRGRFAAPTADGYTRSGRARGGGHGSHGGRRFRRHRPWGLRRRLTFAFAFVALAAVGLTVWLTLGAVFEAQRELFEPPAARDSADLPEESQAPTGQEDDRAGQADSADEPAVEQGGEQGGEHFQPPWWLGGAARGPMWDRGPGDGAGPPWNEPGFAAARNAFRGVSRTAFLAAIISFLLAVAAAAMVTRFLTRPLAALTEGAERLGAGERGIRLDLPSSRDELRSLTEAFNELVTGLERQEAWRRDMVADVAHGLRTPLAVLRSEIEAMQDGVEPVDTAGLGRLHGEVMMIARLVDDLRSLSLAESGALALEPQETSLRPFLEGVAESFAARAAELGVDLRVVEAPDGFGVAFDRQRIRQLLGNLLENALSHGEQGPVELGAAAIDGGARLWVRDHGPGLSEEGLRRVFERFYRSDPARTRGAIAGANTGGSGLGLAIVKALAEAHSGRIEASNHPQGGAVFAVWLPRRSAGSTT